ncbi:XRE family transcriptional regulator [Vibrio cholerae]
MELHEIIKSERERRGISQIELVHQLMERGVDISNATLSRIEKGWIPSFPMVLNCCDIFGWSLAELERRMNDNQIVPQVVDSDEVEFKSERRTIAKTVGREIPVISWVQAGNWSESPHIEEYNQEKRFVPGKMPKRTYALRVTGTSMEDCGGKFHFPDGSLILVNPDADWKINDFVVAVNEQTQEATFKQLIDDCGTKFLKPLNSQFPVMRVTETTTIKGVVFRVIDDRKI